MIQTMQHKLTAVIGLGVLCCSWDGEMRQGHKALRHRHSRKGSMPHYRNYKPIRGLPT